MMGEQKRRREQRKYGGEGQRFLAKGRCPKNRTRTTTMLARQPKPTDARSMAEVAHMHASFSSLRALGLTVLQDTPH